MQPAKRECTRPAPVVSCKRKKIGAFLFPSSRSARKRSPQKACEKKTSNGKNEVNKKVAAAQWRALYSPRLCGDLFFDTARTTQRNSRLRAHTHTDPIGAASFFPSGAALFAVYLSGTLLPRQPRPLFIFFSVFLPQSRGCFGPLRNLAAFFLLAAASARVPPPVGKRKPHWTKRGKKKQPAPHLFRHRLGLDFYRRRLLASLHLRVGRNHTKGSTTQRPPPENNYG